MTTPPTTPAQSSGPGSSDPYDDTTAPTLTDYLLDHRRPLGAAAGVIGAVLILTFILLAIGHQQAHPPTNSLAHQTHATTRTRNSTISNAPPTSTTDSTPTNQGQQTTAATQGQQTPTTIGQRTHTTQQQKTTATPQQTADTPPPTEKPTVVTPVPQLKITGVTFAPAAMTSSSPTVTVTGTLFGTKPAGTPLGTMTCDIGGSGDDYGTAFSFTDEGHFMAGAGGDCISIIISSWTDSQVVFQFGGQYGPNSAGTINAGDIFELNIKGHQAQGSVIFTGG